MGLGENIRFYREKQGISQEKLGEMLGVSFQAVSQWERGLSTPDTGRLTALAGALGTTAGALLEEGPPPDWDLGDRLFHEDRMYTFIKAAAQAQGLEQTLRALPFAKKAHEGQKRKGKAGIPYISHPLTMACHALALGLREGSLLAALLLHDVVEDCGVSLAGLPVDEKTRETVRLVTKDPRHDEDEEGYDRLYFDGIAGHPHATLVKLLDRCHNLSVMAGGFTRQRIPEYVRHTMDYVMPLADLLREKEPRYSDACFLLKYQMLSLMHTVRSLMV